MPRRTLFIPYKPKQILNQHKRADHWFWTRYSAYPYLGCQHGCEFCYCRERKYAPYEDPQDFAHLIKVKINAPELLCKALQRQPREPVFTGDYQPAERKFELSRRMLAVCLELGFPVFVLERSPSVTRDLDLLVEINARTSSIVAFSAISTPDSPHYQTVRQLERLAPPVEKRFKAMEQFAAAGLLTGTCFMPALPGLCDDPSTVENVVRWTANHGGQFVLAAGLTLADQQRDYFFQVLGERFPALLETYQALYPPGSYSSASGDRRSLARLVREFCRRYGLSDRIPRPVIPGEKRALNKRVVERLVDRLYTLELEAEPEKQIWRYRKAAWAVEDLETSLDLLYRSMGKRGLRQIPGVDEAMAEEIAGQVEFFGHQ